MIFDHRRTMLVITLCVLVRAQPEMPKSWQKKSSVKVYGADGRVEKAEQSSALQNIYDDPGHIDTLASKLIQGGMDPLQAHFKAYSMAQNSMSKSLDTIGAPKPRLDHLKAQAASKEKPQRPQSRQQKYEAEFESQGVDPMTAHFEALQSRIQAGDIVQVRPKSNGAPRKSKPAVHQPQKKRGAAAIDWTKMHFHHEEPQHKSFRLGRTRLRRGSHRKTDTKQLAKTPPKQQRNESINQLMKQYQADGLDPMTARFKAMATLQKQTASNAANDGV